MDSVANFSGQRLALLIDTQGRKLDWFAEELGRRLRGEPFHYSYASKLLSGAKPITAEIAVASAAILQVPVDWLRDEAVVSREAIPA